jgi:hypothetical protein
MKLWENNQQLHMQQFKQNKNHPQNKAEMWQKFNVKKLTSLAKFD